MLHIISKYQDTDRKSLLLDTSGNTFKNKQPLNKLISLIKGDANALLTVQQVQAGLYYTKEKGLQQLEGNTSFGLNHSFSIISEKEKIIQSNKTHMLQMISSRGTMIKGSETHELFLDYVRQGYISEEEIKDHLLDFFIKETYRIQKKINTPLAIRQYNGEIGYIGKKYRDPDHDLLIDEQKILSYTINSGLVEDSIEENLEKALKEGGDTLGYFYEKYETQDLLEQYYTKLKQQKSST